MNSPMDLSLSVKPSGRNRFKELELHGHDHVLVSRGSKNHINDVHSLTENIRHLTASLVPSRGCLEGRQSFLEKLNGILLQELPGFKAELFGSTVNGLGMASSDVDVALIGQQQSDPCQLIKDFARKLRNYGMLNVYTISKAKVPICKFYDPEWKLYCDTNLNNIMALRNTKLIRAYVDLDPRVKPLIILIKYWAKRRALNDAAKGGTLSSYCWVMIGLSFLQMRSPPVLPCLHSMYFKQLQLAPNETPRSVIDGVDVSFFEDFKAIMGFGNANKESLGELLYAFFTFFAYEFDYNSFVLSVRHGKLLSKAEKGWNVAVSAKCRFLCVEAPFNPSRNLANSADLVSVMGLIEEFKRAADILAESSDLNKVCEKFLVPRNSIHKSKSSEYLNRPYSFRLGMRPNVRSFGTGMYPIHHKHMQTDYRNPEFFSFQHQDQDVGYYDYSSAYWEEPYDSFTGTKLTQTDYLNSDPSFPPLVSLVNGSSSELDENASSVKCVPEMKKLGTFPTSVWAPVSHLPPARTHFTSHENLRSANNRKSSHSSHKHRDGRSGRSLSLNRGNTGAHSHKQTNHHYQSDLNTVDSAAKPSYRGSKGSFKRVDDKKAVLSREIFSSNKSDDGLTVIYERTNALSLDNSRRKGSKGTVVWSNLSHRHNRSTTVDEEERGRMASSAE